MPSVMFYVPEGLLVQAKKAAGERGIKLSQVVQAAFKVWLEDPSFAAPPTPAPKPSGDAIAQFMTEANRLRSTASREEGES